MKKQLSRFTLVILLIVMLCPLVLLTGCKSDKKYGVTQKGVRYRLYEEEISEREYSTWSMLAPEIVLRKGDACYMKYWYVSGLSKGFLDSCAPVTSPVVKAEIKGTPVAAVNCDLGRESWETITLPDSIRFITGKLTGTANVPSGLLYLGYGAARNVTNLELENGLYYWGNWQVDYSSSRITNTVEVREGTVGICSIPRFKSPDNGASVILPDSVRYIGESCFGGLDGYYPALDLSSVEYVGKEAFSNVFLGESRGPFIASVTFSERLKYLGDHAFYGSHVAELDLSEAGDCIFGEEVFRGAENLTSICLPDGVTEVPVGMFEDSAIMSVTLPRTLKKIGTRAFYGCNLDTISYAGTEEEWRAVEKEKGWYSPTGGKRVTVRYGE